MPFLKSVLGDNVSIKFDSNFESLQGPNWGAEARLAELSDVGAALYQWEHDIPVKKLCIWNST